VRGPLLYGSAEGPDLGKNSTASKAASKGGRDIAILSGDRRPTSRTVTVDVLGSKKVLTDNPHSADLGGNKGKSRGRYFKK